MDIFTEMSLTTSELLKLNIPINNLIHWKAAADTTLFYKDTLYDGIKSGAWEEEWMFQDSTKERSSFQLPEGDVTELELEPHIE